MVPAKFSKAMFGIQHYAARVTYSCEGFLEKNADRLPLEQVADLLAASELRLLRELGKQLEADSPRRRRSATLRFRASLRQLMSKIEASQAHYVRCIKPNALNKKEDFTAQMVQEQLRYSA